jgi:hypothetical protein
MLTPDGDWQVTCTREEFEACRNDLKFPFIVALARTVNSLKFVHSAMVHAGTGNSPESRRGRLNSYFFASAILYEGLKLVRAMSRPFRQDELFKRGLRELLRDKDVQAIEQAHLNPARNKAVFHFLPQFFAATIASATCDECIFASGRGKRREELYYPFADVIAAGILVGYSSDTDGYYARLGKAMSDTSDFMMRFIDAAEFLIAYYIKHWGFRATEILPANPLPPASPEKQ